MIRLLPGLGADRRMYGPEWERLIGVQLINWPPYRGERTLGAVADRVIDEYGIQSDDVVGGCSLGGMVALEIARRLDNPRVILIGSAVAGTEINRLLLALAPLTTVTPVRLVQALIGEAGGGVLAMFADADPDFVRAMCLALPDWPGVEFPADRVVRIHGAIDRVIPCPPDCHVIPGGGHLIAGTHAEECVRVLMLALGADVTRDGNG